MSNARPFAGSARARLFLSGLLVALLSAFALSAWAQPWRHGTATPFVGHISERALDHVSATDDQRTQVRQIMQVAAADLKTQREAGRALREEALALFTQPTVDANAAEALRGKMMAQHEQSSRRMLAAMLDVSRVLSPEQRAKLAEHMKQRREAMQRKWQERGQPRG